MNAILIISCFFAVTMAAPAAHEHRTLKEELLDLLRKELLEEKEEPEPTGWAAMRRELSDLQIRAKNFLAKRDLDEDSHDFAERVLEAVKRLNVEGIRQQAIATCGESESDYLKGSFKDAEKFIQGGPGPAYADADACFKDSVADALTHSIKNPWTGQQAPSADRNPDACGGALGKDPATIDEKYCRHLEKLAVKSS